MHGASAAKKNEARACPRPRILFDSSLSKAWWCNCGGDEINWQSVRIVSSVESRLNGSRWTVKVVEGGHARLIKLANFGWN